MKNEEIVRALRRLKVETGSLPCIGCGRGHRCGVHGCRIMREAAELIEKLTDRCARYAEEIAVLQERQRWIPVEERLPEGDDAVLAVVSGKPMENITLIGSVQIAVYCAEAGWFITEFPGRDEPTVTHWMPLPAAPEVK